MSDLRVLHERAAHRFAAYVKRIEPDQWRLSTPCSEWDVRALVDHVVRWNMFVPDFLAGKSLSQIADPFGGDVLGADPPSAAERSAGAAIDAFNRPGALERLVHHPYGDMPGSQVLYLRLFDNTIHGWDLAHAMGLDEPPDGEAVEVLWAGSVSQREAIRASGHFGPAEITVAEDAPLETRLLGLLGRQA